MRSFRVGVCAVAVVLVSSFAVSTDVSVAEPGRAGQARSDFSASVDSVSLGSGGRDFDPGAVAEKRERRIAAQHRAPGLSRVPAGTVVSKAGTGRVEAIAGRPRAAKAIDAGPMAGPPVRLWEVFTYRLPGKVTWSVRFQPVDYGCRVRLYRASDDVLVASVEETSRACSGVTFYDEPGGVLADGTVYYAEIALWDGGWGPTASTAVADAAARYTPGVAGGQAWGNCVCGTSAGRSQVFQVPVGDPVNTATGAFFEQVSDVSLAAPGVPFELTRTYNSDDASAGLLGKGWSFPYAASLRVAEDRVTYRAEDGQRVVYEERADGSFATPAGVTSTLVAVGNQYELSTKTHETLTFGAVGRLRGWTDSSGQGLSFGYTSGTLTSVTDAAGRTVDLTVVDGKVTRVDLPDGRWVGYSYTGDLLTEVRDLRGGVTQYEWGSAGRLIRILDQKNRQAVKNTYDSTTGRLVEQVDATGGVSTYAARTVDLGMTEATWTDPRGAKWTYVYSANVLVQAIDPLGNVTEYEYDQNLNQVGMVDARGNRTRMGYDGRGNLTSHRSPNPLGYEETWVYDADDNLVEHVDRREKRTTYAYDAAHRVTDETRFLGARELRTHYTYTSRGLLETATSPKGTATSNVPDDFTTGYGYDSAGNLTSVATPEGKVTRYGYDQNGRVTSETSPRGAGTADPDDHTVTFSYDNADNVTSRTDARGNTTEFDYDAVGDLVGETDPLGNTTTFLYDAAHRLLNTTEPHDVVTKHRWDASGNLRSHVDGTGAFTRFIYDPTNRLDTMVTARGMVSGGDQAAYSWTYGYDPNGNQTRVTDPLGNVTRTSYDVVNRPTVVTDPLGHTTTTEYNPNDDVTGVTDHLGNTWATTYDDLGRALTDTTPRGTATTATGDYVTRYRYDRDSNLRSVTSPLGHQTSYGYDQDAQLVSMVDPRGHAGGADPAQYRWRYGYDPDGNPTDVTDPLGNQEHTGFDPNDNPTSYTDANNHTTTWTWDAKDRLATVVSPDRDATTSYGYDELDNLISRTDPRNNTTSYGYDAVGRVIETVDPLGRRITHAYDPEGNLTETVTARGNTTGADPAPWTITGDHDPRGLQTAIGSPDTGLAATFAYDDAGRPTGATGWGGTISYGWDAADRLTSYGRGTAQLTYDYDADGNVTSRRYPNGTTITAHFDQDGRQDTSTRGGEQVQLGYDEAGNLTGLTHPAGPGLSQTRTFDRAGRLQNISNLRNGATVSGYDLTRDGVGNPTQLRLTRGTTDAHETYEYDPADQLTKVCYPTSAAASCAGVTKAIGYEYDLSGNRRTEVRAGVDQPGTTSYSYDNADQLTTSTQADVETSYGHDADGNLTTITTPGTSGSATTFDYDAANRLRARSVDGTRQNQITYDAASNRLGVSQTGQSTQAFTWDPNGELPMLATRTEGSNRTDYRYTDTGLPLETLATTSAGTEAAWLLHDHLGSIVDTLDGTTGAPQTSTSYEPFGTPTTQQHNPNPVDVALGYTGQYTDPRLDLLHLRARDYNPELGQFTAVDPVAPNPAEPYATPYAYVNNQPTRYTDPTGQTRALPPGGGVSRPVPPSGGTVRPPLTNRGNTNIGKAVSRAGWRVGDSIYKLTRRGTNPAWSTVRARFWKNLASNLSRTRKVLCENFTQTNVERMRRGLAPQRYSRDKGGIESMELSHEPVPMRLGGKSLVPRWPKEHALRDFYRRTGY